MDFEKGDRVYYVKPAGVMIDLGVGEGETGTVLYVERNKNLVYVRWDMFHKRRHTCSGRCEKGYGWNVGSTSLRHEVIDLGDLPYHLSSESIANLLGGVL